MRYPTLGFLIVFLPCALYGQPDPDPGEWKEDILHLQQKVHSDYSDLFYKIDAEEFDSAVDDLLAEVPRLEDHEVVVGIARLVARFGYGHTALWLTSWDKENKAGFHRLPMHFYQFSDGLFVQGVHKKYEKALGAKVLRIGDLSAEEALAAVRPVLSVENEMFFKAHGMHYLGVPEILHAQRVIEAMSTTIPFQLEKDGEVFTLEVESMALEGFPGSYGLIREEGDWLEARDTEDTPLWLDSLERIYYFKHLPEQNAVYVRQSQIQDDPREDIPTFYGRVFDYIEENQVDKMVLDLRLNGGGNNYKNKPLVLGLIKSRVNQPGKLYVIIGRRTFSACQNLVNEIETYTDAVFVGEPTGENVIFFGDNRQEVLPNSGLPVYLSFAWWQDKAPWDDRPWLAPQLAVDLSFEDYQSNGDPVLEAIWEHTYKKPPMAYMESLFLEGKMEEVQQVARDYVSDPAYRYYDFEAEFNKAGYQLLQNNRVDGALFVFGLNAEFFPGSANVWDSLAEAHWKKGELEQAREFYRKAISLDPEGPVGANARSNLKKMASEQKEGNH